MALAPRVIGFDADDTLWHNENIFAAVHARFQALLARYHDQDTVAKTQFATEMRNLELYGYGVKAFTLCAIETAIELSGGKIAAEEIRELLVLGRDMLAHPVELLDGADATLRWLHGRYELVLITKGDLRDQERKLEKSGLKRLFAAVEIVSEKDESAYRRILERRGVAPTDFLMVGNSLRSDVVPVLALGGAAVHVPYPLTWAHEHVEALPAAPGRFFEVRSLAELPALLGAR
ncbi:HAD family hydrolase [Nibricoccus sp. IMCC34717]|uniref:HAD family hydrolase n=1 Tax=Nibricoccus sp. IMCC34717 TaxID=3034021 RepID=UPI003850CE72